MEKKIILVSGDFSLKFYDPNRLEIWTKIISVLEENGSKIKRFRMPEQRKRRPWGFAEVV